MTFAQNIVSSNRARNVQMFIEDARMVLNINSMPFVLHYYLRVIVRGRMRVRSGIFCMELYLFFFSMKLMFKFLACEMNDRIWTNRCQLV